MRIAMLGLVDVRADDGTPVEITGARLRTLLILLALDPGRVVTGARLIDGVWGDDPPAEATNALQALVSRLRRALPEPAVESTPAGYRLAVPPDTVDLHRFEQLAALGRAALRTDPRRAAKVLREAEALWRGPALADTANAAFAQAPLARLEERRLAVRGDRIEAELPGADGVELVAELEELVAEHPLHERFTGLLMRALHQAGRSGDALAVHARIRDALADELGANPSAELAALHLEVLRGGETPQDRPHTNLRAGLTSFVGRDTDLAKVSALVGPSRLVTLTGPGGSGKTRLATEVARALLEEMRDVWLVELAPVSDGADLPQAVVSALGLRMPALLGSTLAHSTEPEAVDPVDRLAAALSTRALLLVLDNCEHLIGPAAALANRLLGECPRLRVLATSREPLGITGETLWPVDPLPLPPEGASRDQAMRFPSMRLLADRASAVRPGFAVDDRTALHMIHICRALDGMPLAIELAAARLRTMSAQQVATRLDDRFRLLTGGSRLTLPRHQTLRAVVDWSWDLLGDAERTLLRRLAVFAGGSTLEAAEQVCAGAGLPAVEVFDVLSALLDKSLVLLAEDGRYRMLQTIKAYGLERLADAGETDRVRWAHVEHFGRLAETAEPYLRRAEQLDWIDRLDADKDNLNAALRTAIAAGETRTAEWFLANLGWYWWLHGHKVEGGELAAEVLAMTGEGAPAEVRAVAYGMAALLAVDGLRDADKALSFFTSAVAAAKGIDPGTHPVIRLIGPLDEVMHSLGRPTEPLRLNAIEVLTEDDDPWVCGTAQALRAHAFLNAGRLHAEAEADFRAALGSFRAVGDRWGMSFALCSLADLIAWRGDLAGAAELYQEAILVFSQLVTNEDLTRYRLRLADLLLQLGRTAESAAMLAQARRGADRSGMPEGLARVAHATGDFARRRGGLDPARADLARAAVLAAHTSVAPQFRAVIEASRGYLATAAGDPAAAAAHHATAFDWALKSNDAPMIAHVLVGLAELSIDRGDPRHAAALLGASVAIRGVPDLSFADGVRVEAATRAALGEELFAESAARGASATMDTVRELAVIPAA
ncbi:MAG: AAA family ATPase [Actinophytocola sp.]|uniref:BTAD domain-containing putative transcriptional regulator n=1 Tax=Actinophytocola sp. TaxID=1872138 RepID=UPI001325D8AF|nr:BTAD domain-containing putative transcriptional regulator [Actinophytocola sp.]MPZ79376.1 AAA family ATPase [Actinophytocola sp.]